MIYRKKKLDDGSGDRNQELQDKPGRTHAASAVLMVALVMQLF